MVTVPNLTRDDVRTAMIEALKSEAGAAVLAEAMAKKLELTAGWRCHDAGERAEIRKNQEFIRDLRLTARRGFHHFLARMLTI
ncbi:hypothetical protein HUN39_04690 [Methylocystis sp. FS]|uniref:hypothetical protein n=1 Tax=Methylocystis silviterrae TaxID=2743612 RepID=UPI00158223E1|nr:hypothetical protein [Methylocystis silviterrae]NUJ79336.1 hypothetical protein [Methylocystis silviterrae]